MAQSNFAERLDIDGLQIECTNVMTGDKNRNRFLYYQLKMSILKANKIDIIVSFLIESGVRMILKDLKAAFNISRSALTSGIEWNYRFNSLDDKKNFCLFYDTFVELFE